MEELMSVSLVRDYLQQTKPDKLSTGFLAYLANLENTAAVAPEIARAIVQELQDQRSNIKLIASENYTSLNTQLTMGNLLTDKYAEGYPEHRFYAGCTNVDTIESRACELACQLFGAEHAYVQPHSGADANMVAFWAILRGRIEMPRLEKLNAKMPGDLSQADWNKLRQELGNQRLLGLDLASGGHLTHGYRLNVSGRMFESFSYAVNPQTSLLDYDAIEKQAVEVKPLVLLAGYSAYPRKVNFKRMREIADKVGAVFMVDMAHFAGLVAGGVFTGDYHPVQHAHIVTTTTHKTLRGPRGGLILSTAEFADQIDKGCPLVLGGPLPHVMAAKAVCFTEALRPEFKTYAAGIVQNSQAICAAFEKNGQPVVSGGTDNHLLLLNVSRNNGLSGRQAESAVRACGITLNRNTVPCPPDGSDPEGAWYTSGLRLGTPAVTTLGMGTAEMQEIADIMTLILSTTQAGTTASGKPSRAEFTTKDSALKEARARVTALLSRFPVYPELDLEFLKSRLG